MTPKGTPKGDPKRKPQSPQKSLEWIRPPSPQKESPKSQRRDTERPKKGHWGGGGGLQVDAPDDQVISSLLANEVWVVREVLLAVVPAPQHAWKGGGVQNETSSPKHREWTLKRDQTSKRNNCSPEKERSVLQRREIGPPKGERNWSSKGERDQSSKGERHQSSKGEIRPPKGEISPA